MAILSFVETAPCRRRLLSTWFVLCYLKCKQTSENVFSFQRLFVSVLTRRQEIRKAISDFKPEKNNNQNLYFRLVSDQGILSSFLSRRPSSSLPLQSTDNCRELLAGCAALCAQLGLRRSFSCSDVSAAKDSANPLRRCMHYLDMFFSRFFWTWRRKVGTFNPLFE